MSITLKTGAESTISSGDHFKMIFVNFIIIEKQHSNEVLPASHFFPSLKQEINPSSLPSIARAKAHDFKEFVTISVEISSHNLIIDSTTSLLGSGFVFPEARYSCFALANQSSYRSLILSLNGLFQTTCGAGTYLIQPPGKITVSIFELASVYLASPVK